MFIRINLYFNLKMKNYASTFVYSYVFSILCNGSTDIYSYKYVCQACFLFH